MSGAAILDALAAFVGRFVVFPSTHCLTAVVLWAAHTHAPRDTFYVTPRLVLDSAEPGSGKTRVLELLALLVHQPEMTISATVAAIFRMLAEQPHTLLFDEVDAIFNPKNGGNYEDLRALLNAGYKQGATIARCVGDAKAMKVERFTVFAPAALAGLAGNMPATITTRSVTIRMRKRAPGEQVEPFRERDASREAAPLRRRIEKWISAHAAQLAEARPDMPAGVVDRPAEVWEALIAVADAAGGRWPTLAREACAYFVLQRAGEPPSPGVRLLADIRALFAEHGVEKMPTAELLTELAALDEAPWRDYNGGKGLSARNLATMLGRYGVTPVQWKRPGEQKNTRGYVTGPDQAQAGLADAWTRYLPSAGTSGTSGTPHVSPVPDAALVPDRSGTSHRAGTGLTREVPEVPEVPQQSRATGVWRASGLPVDAA